jgi:hypothetical protein
VLGVICFRITKRIAQTGPDRDAPPLDDVPAGDELSLV